MTIHVLYYMLHRPSLHVTWGLSNSAHRKKNMLVFVAVFCVILVPSLQLDNGLAKTPPMGWLSWERYRCTIDCDLYPDECLSERLIKSTADLMVSEGYRDLGYEYVIIDDCWPSMNRTAEGRLQGDSKRFPSGMKALGDYIHSKGLKFGIYEDFGTKTCGGYPGSEYYLQMDANTFAEWGVDYLKLDGCNAVSSQYTDAYPAMSMWLNRTGRPIAFSCSWPAYSSKPDYHKIAKYCNLWRNYGDIQDSWASVSGIIKHYGDDPGNFSQVAGPGAWNDPDMLVIGNFGLSYEQQRTQMGLWAIMASPLIMSNDLKNVRQESKDILQNKNVIAINQDKQGIQGRRIIQASENRAVPISVWTKPILPADSIAFAYVNMGDSVPHKFSYTLQQMGLTGQQSYDIYEVFSGTHMGTYQTNQAIVAEVNPSGIFLGKAIAQQAPVIDHAK